MRFIDDLENSPNAPLPTPAEVEATLRKAHAMRDAAMAAHIAGFWRMIARATTPLRARGDAGQRRHGGPRMGGTATANG